MRGRVSARLLDLQGRAGTYLNYLLLALGACTTLYPMWYVTVYALSDPLAVAASGAILLPKQFTLSALEFVLTSPRIGRAYLNTAFVVTVGTLLNLIVTSLYAYPLSRPIPGGRVISFLTYFTILFGGGMVPTYVIVRATGLLDSLWSLIVPALINPFYVFIMIKFFRAIPESLQDSARIDGANDLFVLVRIIVPLSMPLIASISLFYAVGHWNSFFQAIIYIANPNRWPIQVILRQLLQVHEESQFAQGMATGDQTAASMTGETVKMATVVVATVPILLIYPFLQKYFAKGVMIGAVKG